MLSVGISVSVGMTLAKNLIVFRMGTAENHGHICVSFVTLVILVPCLPGKFFAYTVSARRFSEVVAGFCPKYRKDWALGD